MKRIFVAIPISENLQERILLWEKEHLNLPVRWLSGKNLHVTLVPPWYTDDVQTVITKLKTVSGRPFEMQFNQISFAPNSKATTIIWASGSATKEIKDLRLRIYNALGQTPENRDFRLHITLARFRVGDFANFPIKTLIEEINWRERIKSFVLMQSHLSSARADYEVLAPFALKRQKEYYKDVIPNLFRNP